MRTLKNLFILAWQILIVIALFPFLLLSGFFGVFNHFPKPEER
jgi:hypothetical protein